MREAVIVAAGRSPVGKAPRGTLRYTRSDDLAAQVIQGLLARAAPLSPEEVDDVILGCAFPEAEQGMNVSRIAALRAGLPEHVSSMTVNRFCSSGLQSIALATQSIRCGFNEVVIAGGTESMSLVPMEGHRFSPNPTLVAQNADVYTSMGLTAENVASRYGISRERQDEFSLRSHERAVEAQDSGRFEGELIAVEVEVERLENGRKESHSLEFRSDEGPRRDTSMQALSHLRPVFRVNGTVTAGNSSQRSDGAAGAIVVSDRKAEELGLEPIGRLVSFATAGVAPELMGIGPVEAVPKALRLADIELKEIGLVELNEAFASQALAVAEELGLDLDKLNVNGGAIALGHPLGATGAKLTATSLSEMERRGVRYGLVTMCVGGGMGAAGVIECYRAE
ncbi:MAG: thiolase family protein [Acidobacteriota bacterium]